MRVTAAVIALFLSALTVHARMHVPSYVSSVAEIAEAVTDARDSEKAVAFLMTNTSSTCPYCIGSTKIILRDLRSRAEIVLVRSGSNEDWGKLARPVQKALVSAEAGMYIPRAVVFDPGLEHLITVIPYRKGTGQTMLVKDAKKEIAKALAAQEDEAEEAVQEPAVKPITLGPAVDREMRSWTSSSGATVEAALYEEAGPRVILLKDDGSKLTILKQLLSKPDQSYIESLKTPAPAPTP